MAISEREQAGEFISIKQIWLAQINRCNESLSNYALKNSETNSSGTRAAISSVNILVLNLINFGDAPLKDDFDRWKEGAKDKFPKMSGLAIAKLKLEKIIGIMNKYQLLCDSLPRGYSNVILEGVKEVNKDG